MTKTTALSAAILLLLPRAAAACPVCFGADDGPMLQGSNMGILALLVVTISMLCAFGGFFLTLARRAARALPEAPSPLDAMEQPEGPAR